MFRFICIAAALALSSAFQAPAISPKLAGSAVAPVMNEAAAKAAWLAKADSKGSWGPGSAAPGRMVPSSAPGNVVPTGAFATNIRGPGEFPAAGSMFDKEGSYGAHLAQNGILNAEGGYATGMGAKVAADTRYRPTNPFKTMERAPGEYPAPGSVFEKEGSFAEFQARNGLLMTDHFDPWM